MQPIIECWFPERLCVGLHLTILRACARGRARKWAMLMLLMVVMFPWPSVGETANPASSCAPEHAASSLRRGRVILPSNLRSSPSVQSEIVGVVKEGAQVRILLESGHWYQVRSENGVAAWIYKPLVVVEQEPIQEPSGLPEALNPLDIEDTTSAAASATPDAVVEFLLENTTDALGLDAGTAELVDEPHVPPPINWTAWLIDIGRPYFRDSVTYFIIALVIVLLLSITLQLRAARHLRRALQEMGQILDAVEEIYIGGMLARTRDSDIALYPRAAETLAQEHMRPGIEFLPTEFTVLEALSDQREVQETELGKSLTEKGYAGVLIKAVVGSIVRKSRIMGLPWVEVRYDGGRYHYRLRPEAVPNLRAQQLQKRSERGAVHPQARSFRPADAGVRGWIRNYSPANTLYML